MKRPFRLNTRQTEGVSHVYRSYAGLYCAYFARPACQIYTRVSTHRDTGKGTSVPLQAWSDPEGSRKLRFPDFITTAQDGGKFVSLTHRPPLSPGNTPGTHFC